MNTQPTAPHNSRRGIFLIAAIALISIGATLLVSRADLAVAHFSTAAGDSAEQFGSSVPGLILAVDRAAQAWAFHRSTVLSCLRDMLLSCWPVLLVMFGALLLQDWPLSGQPQQNAPYDNAIGLPHSGRPRTNPKENR